MEVKQVGMVPHVLGKVAKRRCSEKDLNATEIFRISTDCRQPLGSFLTTGSTNSMNVTLSSILNCLSLLVHVSTLPNTLDSTLQAFLDIHTQM